MEDIDKVGILIVDDRLDKVLALEAILADLGKVSMVRAQSGRDALKQLLQQDFAVILLDVNMPGMDGFETAEMIRQRKNCEQTPIIFITSSYDAETHVWRGYSLGAVDYILAPVVPEVLRTKVQVFVDLYRKNRQLARRSSQLQRLNQGSLALNSAGSVEAILRISAEFARELTNSNRAISSTSISQIWANASRVESRAAQIEQPIRDADIFPIHSLICSDNRSINMIGEQWRKHKLGAESLLTGGWVAAPLTDHEGRNIGLLLAAERNDGSDFSEDDHAILLQLAQMTSVAIENVINYEAREANKIKDEFLATLSHELRTPLTSMLAWTRILRTENVSEDKRVRGMSVIERNVRTQMKLIDDLLDVSRIISGKLRLNFRAISLTQLLETAIDAIRPSADEKQITIKTEFEKNVDKLLGDGDRLQQVFNNLLTNAVKFTNAEGMIQVRMECDESQIKVSIIDNGIGIDPAFLPHIFDRFRQADSSTTRTRGGLGLGLAIVRHLVEAHGGIVRAESAGTGLGSAFIVQLPVVAVRVSSKEDTTQPRLIVNSIVNLADSKVLVVDDEPDSRESLCELIRGSKADVRSASSAAEALTILDHFCPDVLVSDIGMPGEDGYSLITKVRQHALNDRRTVPALALTAYARDEDRQRALNCGFNQHLSKPVEPADLIAHVALLVKQRNANIIGDGNKLEPSCLK